jgi:hypothetical protein
MCFLFYKNHCSKATPDSKRKRKGPTAKSKENENDSATKPKIIKKEDATTPKVVKKSPVETSGQFGTEEKQHVTYTVGGSSYFFCRLWQRQCAEI